MKEGDVWNGWTVDSLIGEGRFGKVYKIVRTEYGHTYESALKVMRIPASDAEVNAVKNEGMDDESAEAYFRGMVEEIVSEFTLMSEFRGNSNIVSYEDHQVVKRENELVWDVYIRMELLTPLIEHIHNTAFTIKDVINLGIDMCLALELCQSKNIIHRDIKPENIFYSRTGNYKLGDFGIAREMSGTSAMTRVGTPSYMAPEIAKGFAYNSKADIYSLGIVLYRLLNNNRLPFLPPYPQSIGYRDREEANKKRMRGEEMLPPCNANEDLTKIVLKACAYKPENRFASAADMRAALEIVDTSEKIAGVIPEKETLSKHKEVSTPAPIEDKSGNGTDRRENKSDTSKDKKPIENIAGSERVADSKEHEKQSNSGHRVEGVSEQKNSGEALEKKREKRRKTGKKIAIILLVIILILAAMAGAALYLTDYYLVYFTPEYEVGEISEEDKEYGFNGSWGYDEDKTKKIIYEDVTAYVPTNWRRLMLDMSDYGIDEAEGRLAELRDSDNNRVAWFKIEFMGSYSTLEEYNASERAKKFNLKGEKISIEGCEEACSYGCFNNQDGETVMAIVVIVNGNAYWIGGGAVGDNFSITNYTKMINSCEFKVKE